MSRAAEPIVSVVIPTRNRPASLARTLEAIARQTRPAHEIVIVDSSDRPPAEPALRGLDPALPPLVCLHTRPGVCAQRNIGIRHATGSHVLLCDDDIELPPDYLAMLVAYLHDHDSAGALSGVVCEAVDAGGFWNGLTAPSIRHLLFAFLFQLTVWADVESAKTGWLGAMPLRALKRWYRRRHNTWTAAGWPLVTQVSGHGSASSSAAATGRVLHTATYGLGAALIRRNWLLDSPYDERLGPHGIGDNYGVALGFPGERPITVLVDLPVLHHRAAENRLDQADAYFRRVLALDYFIRTRARFSNTSVAWLAWSLLGKSVLFVRARRGDMLRSTFRALAIVLGGRNPLVAAAHHPAESAPALASPQVPPQATSVARGPRTSPHATDVAGRPRIEG